MRFRFGILDLGPRSSRGFQNGNCHCFIRRRGNCLGTFRFDDSGSVPTCDISCSGGPGSHPLGQIIAEGVHATVRAGKAQNREASFLLPASYRSFISPKVGCDLFPRIQPAIGGTLAPILDHCLRCPEMSQLVPCLGMAGRPKYSAWADRIKASLSLIITTKMRFPVYTGNPSVKFALSVTPTKSGPKSGSSVQPDGTSHAPL